MKDERLKLNQLGFYEVIDRPSPLDLADYYSNQYFQNETSNYRKSYP